MFKRILASLLLTLPFLGYADNNLASDPTDAFKGFFLNGGLGFITQSGTAKLQADDGPVTVLNTSHMGSTTGKAIHFGAGYDFKLNDKFLLGLQAFYNNSDLMFSSDLDGSFLVINEDFSFKETHKYSYGLAGRFAYAWSDTAMAYVFAGPLWTKAHLDESITPAFGTTSSQSVDQSGRGTLTGIGLEQKITKKLALSEQFIYVFQPDYKATLLSQNFGSIRMSQHNMGAFLGLSYHF